MSTQRESACLTAISAKKIIIVSHLHNYFVNENDLSDKIIINYMCNYCISLYQ